MAPQDSNLIIVPASGIDSSVKGSMIDVGWEGAKNSGMIGGGLGAQQNLLQESGGVIVTDMETGFSGQYESSQYVGQYGSGQYGGGQYGGGNMTFDNTRFMKFNDSAAWHTWQTNGLFLQQVKWL